MLVTNFAEPITILQLTDLHLMAKPKATINNIDSTLSFRKTLDYALKQHPNPNLILLTGDLAEEAMPASYQRLSDILAKYAVTFACLPGNHDDYQAMLAVLNQHKFNCNKQWLIGNWQILMLNTQIENASVGALSQQEMLFIKQSLAQHSDKNTLLAMHHHCIKTNISWMDAMSLKNSQEFLALLKRNQQVKGVVMGHIHQEINTSIGNLKLLATPATCFQFNAPRDLTGYRWLNLYPNGNLQTGVNYVQ